MTRRTMLMTMPAAAAGAASNRVEELKKLRWGIFVCWSFSTFSDQEWTRGIEEVSFFKPTGLDTDQWARVAKEAGMGYILFLTKHHDGFCLWDTRTTDRKVTRSPLGRDVLAELRKSCDRHGVKLALYFSEGDWTWPEYRDPEKKKAQLRELLTSYGPIEYFWMDHAQTDGGLSHKDTVAFVKSIQPDCFVGFNHGEHAGDIRLRELGGPGPANDETAGGPYATAGGKYEVAEFALPILGDMGRWFYTNEKNDRVARSPWQLVGLHMGAAKYGNLFSVDVGPGRDGRLRPIDERVLLEAGKIIRSMKCS